MPFLNFFKPLNLQPLRIPTLTKGISSAK